MPNHLVDQTSPYLLQHKDNPVDWYPWGETALSRAREENKPIFLSVGYAACHWCHVMAHESFEDPEIANYLNKNFINIKVDREERPDLDDIYMQAVIKLTGRGGWPMSVFLTPELKPFHGGTYFPPAPRHGLPSFEQVLKMVIDAWLTRIEAVKHNADLLTSAIQQEQTMLVESNPAIDLSAVIMNLHTRYDWQTGGWGSAPKFPQPMLIEFLIQQALTGNQLAYEMADHLLEQMALGGLYDIVGGGFHRYSTDAAWLIPHFEKMLYDNAQLALTYLHGHSLTGKGVFRQVAVDTLDFIQREMTNLHGGFISSIDADTSEGEGRFYAWQIQELDEILSEEDSAFLKNLTNVNKLGNFTAGLNILQLKSPRHQIANQMKISEADLSNRLQKITHQLRDAREVRLPPKKDHKVIVEWNAMAIRAFTEAGLLLKRDDYLEIAQKAMDFLINHLPTPEGRLHRIWNDGQSSHPGTLADYASFIIALHGIYSINFNPIFFELMQSIFKTMREIFASGKVLYYDTDVSVLDLIVRPRNLQDNVKPSGNALAAYVHWLFGNYESDPLQFETSEGMVSQVVEKAGNYPNHHGFWLQVADLLTNESKQIALVSQEPLTSLRPFLNAYRKTYRPFSIIAARHSDFDFKTGIPSILRDRSTINGKPTAYVCQGFTCQMPVNTAKAFEQQLDQIQK